MALLELNNWLTGKDEQRAAIYFAYGKSHSRLNAPPPEMPEGIKPSK